MIIKTYEQILDETVNRIKLLKPELEIDVEGSACRTMVQSICGQIANCYIDIDNMAKDFLIDSAQGVKLNSIGNSYNVSRNVNDTDDTYRTRVVESYANSTQSITNALISSIYDNISNVAQVVVENYIAGPGSFVFYLVPVNEMITNDELTLAKEIIDGSQACGILGMVKRAKITSVQMTMRLSFSNSTGDVYNQNMLKSSAVSAVISYLESFKVGDTMVLSTIITRVRNLSKYIIDVSIDNLIIDGKAMIVRNYTPSKFEVIRPATNSPVTIV